MRDPVLTFLAVCAGLYAVLVLSHGHLDPCRALMARAIHQVPPPPTDPIGAVVVQWAIDDFQRKISRNGPLRCTAAIAQNMIGAPITVLR